MRRMPWIIRLWPGLPQLWSCGSWAGLALAFGSAVLLNLLLLVSFGWSELIGQNWRMILWIALGGVWAMAAVWSVQWSVQPTMARNPDLQKDAFVEALDHYLKGDYYQAEQVLGDLLLQNLRDLDARLMLATLLRHTGRLDEAVQQLDTLARFEGADKWALEMRQERELLTAAGKQKATAA
jgi:hypothetical protein